MIEESDATLEPEQLDAPTHASFTVDDESDAFVVHVAGELDAETSPQLRAHLEQGFTSGSGLVAVDLAALEFVDSVGLSVLVAAHNRAQQDGARFQVRNLPDGPRRVFEITGLVEVFDLR